MNKNDSTPVRNTGALIASYISGGQHDPSMIATSASPGTLYIQYAARGQTNPIGLFQKFGLATKDTDWRRISPSGSTSDLNTILHGSGPPSISLGDSGDFYLDITSYQMYGPKLSGAWGGPTTLRGTNGQDGAVGQTGAKGDRGEQGLQGDVGPQGAKGDLGEQGLRGDTGQAGADGTNGLNGTNGADGATGAKGDKGDQGEQGIQGNQGDMGVQGVQGVQGIQGMDGDTGPKGDKGDQGIQGPKGDVGPNDFYEGYYGISQSDVDVKRFTLPHDIFSPDEFELEIIGGGIQNPGVDYEIENNNIVSWAGLNLDGVLDATDKAFLSYKTATAI